MDVGTELLEPGARKHPVGGALEPVRVAEVAKRVRAHRLVDECGELATLDPLQALGIEAAGRPRVEHRPAADGGLRAEDDAIALRGHDRLLEPELHETATLRDPRRDGGGA